MALLALMLLAALLLAVVVLWTRLCESAGCGSRCRAAA